MPNHLRPVSTSHLKPSKPLHKYSAHKAKDRAQHSPHYPLSPVPEAFLTQRQAGRMLPIVRRTQNPSCVKFVLG